MVFYPSDIRINIITKVSFFKESSKHAWHSKGLNTLFLLSPYLCVIIGFICDLSVARYDSWISKKTSTTEQIYIFTSLEAECEGLGPVMLAKDTPPVIHYIERSPS